MTDDARHAPGAPESIPDWDTLARFVAGESSADEISHVTQWLDANPAERALLERLSEVTAASTESGIDVEAALAKVHARMGQSHPATRSITEAPSRRRWWPLTSVAVLAAAAAIGFLLVSRRQSAPSPRKTPITVASRTYLTSY